MPKDRHGTQNSRGGVALLDRGRRRGAVTPGRRGGAVTPGRRGGAVTSGRRSSAVIPGEAEWRFDKGETTL